MGRKPGNKSTTVAGLLTSLGLVVPSAALPACDAIFTGNPAPEDVGFDATSDRPDMGIRDGGPIGTENPAPPDIGVVDEDASEGDAAIDDAGMDDDAATDDAAMDAALDDDAGEDGAG